MQNRELNRQHQRLKLLISRTQEIASIQLQAHWGGYLCVLAVGFLENAIKEIYGDYVGSAAHARLIRYTTRSLSQVKTPKAERFFQVAGNFDETWAEELRAYLDDDGRGDAINSLINARHQIAHGRDTTITVARVDRHLGKAVEVLEFIEAQCRQ